MAKIASPQIPTTTWKFPSQQNFTSPQWADIPGFPTSVANMVGTWINTWGRLRGLKRLLKNTCHGVHISLQAYKPISLQACKFVKNKLLHAYVLRIFLLNFKLLFIVFSRNHFLEEGFTFQEGRGVVFQMGGFIFK